jgi:hypothetical protein
MIKVIKMVKKYNLNQNVEALQWKGNNGEEFCNFLKVNKDFIFDERFNKNNELEIYLIIYGRSAQFVFLNDWVIKNEFGEIYKCKDDEFKKNYKQILSS